MPKGYAVNIDIIFNFYVYCHCGVSNMKNAPAQPLRKHLTMNWYILQEEQKLITQIQNTSTTSFKYFKCINSKIDSTSGKNHERHYPRRWHRLRLYPLTKVTNKHLLPVYDKPMIYYPLQTLLKTGIKDIMIVSGRGHAGYFLELLGSGADFNARFTYEIQDEAGGIAQALALAEDFATTTM